MLQAGIENMFYANKEQTEQDVQSCKTDLSPALSYLAFSQLGWRGSPFPEGCGFQPVLDGGAAGEFLCLV